MFNSTGNTIAGSNLVKPQAQTNIIMLIPIFIIHQSMDDETIFEESNIFV